MAGLSNQPEMNIAGQINKALDDIRQCLITAANTDTVGQAHHNLDKARYTLTMADNMVTRYRQGIKTPWREYQPAIDEEYR